MQAGTGRTAPTTADQTGDRSQRVCMIISEPGPDATTLQAAIAAIAPKVQLASPAEVGTQLWRSTGLRMLIACGPEAVAAMMPWMPLLHSAANTGTLALLDGGRDELVAVLEQFDLWMPRRTPAAVVAQQVAAQWSLMDRQLRLNSPRRIPGHNLVIDLDREEALDQTEERIPLTPSEFRLLAAMAVQPGRVVDFWQLGAALPGQFRDAEDAYNSIKVHVGRLRQKLTKATGWDGHLVSVRGRGFLFERRAPRATPGTLGEEPVDESTPADAEATD